jgi:hypothetical protein
VLKFFESESGNYDSMATGRMTIHPIHYLFSMFSRLAFWWGLWLPNSTSSMLRNRNYLFFGRTANALMAFFAIGLMLAVGFFAVNPSLHQRLHAESDHGDHFCVVCALASSQLNCAESATIIVVASGIVFFGIFLRENPLVSCLDLYSSPCRAPPRL